MEIQMFPPSTPEYPHTGCQQAMEHLSCQNRNPPECILKEKHAIPQKRNSTAIRKNSRALVWCHSKHHFYGKNAHRVQAWLQQTVLPRGLWWAEGEWNPPQDRCFMVIYMWKQWIFTRDRSAESGMAKPNWSAAAKIYLWEVGNMWLKAVTDITVLWYQKIKSLNALFLICWFKQLQLINVHYLRD